MKPTPHLVAVTMVRNMLTTLVTIGVLYTVFWGFWNHGYTVVCSLGLWEPWMCHSLRSKAFEFMHVKVVTT